MAVNKTQPKFPTASYLFKLFLGFPLTTLHSHVQAPDEAVLNKFDGADSKP